MKGSNREYIWKLGEPQRIAEENQRFAEAMVKLSEKASTIFSNLKIVRR